jgi:hypothetical protein
MPRRRDRENLIWWVVLIAAVLVALMLALTWKPGA